MENIKIVKQEKTDDPPLWVMAIMAAGGLGLAGLAMYNNIEIRYAFLTIGIVCGSAIVGMSIISASWHLVDYLRTRNLVVPHKFETKPPKPESWKSR